MSDSQDVEQWTKFSATRLCQGLSLMLSPTQSVHLDIDIIQNSFEFVNRFEDEFVKIMWKKILVTVYKNGSMLFYHLSDKDIATTYATDIYDIIFEKKGIQ